MVTKLNSFTIPDGTIREMEHLSDLTFVTGNEHGFNLCIDKDRIVKPGNICEGENCSMNISGLTCKENEKNIGIFHTHDKSSYPSMSDLSVGYLVGINCIGSPKEIKCYSRKKDIDAIEYADIKNVKHKEDLANLQHSKWKNKEISAREYTNIYNAYKKEVDRIIKDYFKETKLDY
jgi:hypothetical protein